MADELILGLRLTEGIEKAAFRNRYGVEVSRKYGEVIAEFAGYGLLEDTASYLRLTRRGRLLSNEFFQRLLPTAEATGAPA
jgi:oxygen-independent coproporphyrinogen-3 oxidase